MADLLVLELHLARLDSVGVGKQFAVCDLPEQLISLLQFGDLPVRFLGVHVYVLARQWLWLE